MTRVCSLLYMIVNSTSKMYDITLSLYNILYVSASAGTIAKIHFTCTWSKGLYQKQIDTQLNNLVEGTLFFIYYKGRLYCGEHSKGEFILFFPLLQRENLVWGDAIFSPHYKGRFLCGGMLFFPHTTKGDFCVWGTLFFPLTTKNFVWGDTIYSLFIIGKILK